MCEKTENGDSKSQRAIEVAQFSPAQMQVVERATESKMIETDIMDNDTAEYCVQCYIQCTQGNCRFCNY